LKKEKEDREYLQAQIKNGKGEIIGNVKLKKIGVIGKRLSFYGTSSKNNEILGVRVILKNG